MKEIFTDIYNKVLNFFQNSKEEQENSKATACNRLKLVLMQDRVHLDPFIMQKMREEMINILNKYLEIDNEALDLNLAGEGDSVALMFNIPVIRAKSNEEIEEYEKAMKEKLAEEVATEEKSEEKSDTDENIEEKEDNTEKASDNIESKEDIEIVESNDEEKTENSSEVSENNDNETFEDNVEVVSKNKKSSKKTENEE